MRAWRRSGGRRRPCSCGRAKRTRGGRCRRRARCGRDSNTGREFTNRSTVAVHALTAAQVRARLHTTAAVQTRLLVAAITTLTIGSRVASNAQANAEAVVAEARSAILTRVSEATAVGDLATSAAVALGTDAHTLTVLVCGRAAVLACNATAWVSRLTELAGVARWACARALTVDGDTRATVLTRIRQTAAVGGLTKLPAVASWTHACALAV